VKFVILFWDGSASWLKGGKEAFHAHSYQGYKELKNDCSTPLSIVLDFEQRQRAFQN
jgi:hypothetical protein